MHSHHFRVFFFQGRSKRYLYNCYYVLFLIDKEIGLQPVNTVKILIVPIIGYLILYIDKDQNRSGYPYSQTKQIKDCKDLITTFTIILKQ